MELRDETLERAILMAEKEGIEITPENAESYFLAALAEEELLIKSFINTAKGQTTFKAISRNMACRMYASIQ